MQWRRKVAALLQQHPHLENFYQTKICVKYFCRTEYVATLQLGSLFREKHKKVLSRAMAIEPSYASKYVLLQQWRHEVDNNLLTKFVEPLRFIKLAKVGFKASIYVDLFTDVGIYVY